MIKTSRGLGLAGAVVLGVIGFFGAECERQGVVRTRSTGWSVQPDSASV